MSIRVVEVDILELVDEVEILLEVELVDKEVDVD